MSASVRDALKRYPIFSRHDASGFWALFADNLANMVIVSTICVGVFQMPHRVVFGRILPGLGVALLLGLSFYAYMAYRLAQQEDRNNVTALPYGISTPVLFVYLFGIMMPVYQKGLSENLAAEQAGIMAWQVAVAAAFLGGLLEMGGAILGPFLKRITPRAGMLGTLAGIALVYIATVPLAEVVEHPLIGFPSLAIVFIALVARYRLPGNLPAGLVAIVVGICAALLTGAIPWSTAPFKQIGFYPPIPVLGDLWSGLVLLFQKFPVLLAVVLPIEIYNFIETMNNVESAEAAGDSYPVATCQVADGTGTLLGALCGSPFPTTVYIGHPAYKRLGARGGYALGVGLVFFFIALFGLMGLLYQWIPVAAVAPILIFVGISVAAQAFQATPSRHAIAVAVALLPHIADILSNRMSGVLREAASWLSPAASAVPALKDKLSAMQQASLDPALLQRLLSNAYIHYEGQHILSRGAILVGLLWGAITASLLDHRAQRAALFSLAAALLALVGIIHSPGGLGFHFTNEMFLGYLILAACCFGASFLGTSSDLPPYLAKDPPAPTPPPDDAKEPEATNKTTPKEPVSTEHPPPDDAKEPETTDKTPPRK